MGKREKSCGAVVFTRIDHQIQYIIIKNMEGICGFPKGHVEGKETETQTAKREVYEETQILAELLEGFRVEESYLLPNTDITKQVVYFLGYFENQNFVYQKEELTGIALVSFEEALAMLPFESSRKILTEANDFLTARYHAKQ